MSEPQIFQFERFTLDIGRGSLAVRGEQVKLRPKSFRLLQLLAENPERLLSKSEILEQIWGETIVTEDAVAQCVIDIRRALGDSDQSLIKTVPRRGYLLDAVPVDSAPEIAPESRQRLLLTVAAVAILGMTAWWFTQRPPDVEETDLQAIATAPMSIAVLPFTDMSADGNLSYFAEGVAEEVINLLTRAEDLRVIARTSTFSRKVRDADISTIRDLLAVSHVLEGSVREQGSIVRVSVQLIDAITGERLWSQDYERRLDDVLIIQDQIASQVLQRLAIQLQIPASRAYKPDDKAYQLYLQALYLLNTLPANKLNDIEELISESLAIDSNFAPAWREYSRVWLRKVSAGYDPRIAIAKMDEAFARAIELDPNDAEMIAYRAWHAVDFEGDPANAARLFVEALAAEPANENVLRGATMFMLAFGSPVDAVRLAQYGVSTNPLCFVCYRSLATAYEQNHDFAAAQETWLHIETIFQRSVGADALSLLLTGRLEEMLARHDEGTSDRQRLFEEALAFHDMGWLAESGDAIQQYAELTRNETPWGIALLYAYTGRVEESFVALDQAVQRMQVELDGQTVRHNLIMIGMTLRNPIFEPLHDDPRWQALHLRIGLVAPDLTALSELIHQLDVDTDA